MKRKAADSAQSNYRSAFYRQPARILLIDAPSLSPDVTSSLTKALQNFGSLVCNLNGPNRIPFFGIVSLLNRPEVLFPLLPLRGNFTRLDTALRDLNHQCRQGTVSLSTVDLLAKAIMESVSMFRRQAQGLLQTAGFWAQLELTLVTSQRVDKIIKQLRSATQQLDMEGLKKIQVLAVDSGEAMSVADSIPSLMTDSQSSEGSGNNSSQSLSDSSGIIDFIRIDNSVLCFESYMMGWLHDTTTDQEHLHLLLPPIDQGSALTLKCDLQERILNPSNLPYPNHYFLGLEGTISKAGVQANNRAQAQTVPVNKLQILHRLNADSLCESVLFGMPLIAKATSCWQIDWDELEINQVRFLALCQQLLQKNEVLVAQLVNDKPTESRGFRYDIEQHKPSGMFILLPSQRGSLLVKSVATRELILPLDVTSTDQVPESNVLDILHSLDQVELLCTYNPLLQTSDLHQSLIAHMTKSYPTAPQAKPHTTVPAPLPKPSNTSSFTPAKWAMQQHSGNQRGNHFYSKSRPPSAAGDFPTEL